MADGQNNSSTPDQHSEPVSLSELLTEAWERG